MSDPFTPKPTHVCIKKCYYMNHLFEVGELLDPSVQPNKHFAPLNGPMPQENKKIGGLTAADDPRSTVELITELQNKYKIKAAAGAKRRDIWRQLRELETGGPVQTVTAGKNMPPKPPDTVGSVETGANIPDKRLVDMTPDELDKLKVKDIADYMMKYHRIDMKVGGKKTADVLKAAIAIESGEKQE